MIVDQANRLVDSKTRGNELQIASWFDDGEIAEDSKVEFMAVYQDGVKTLSAEFGEPTYSGPGPCKIRGIQPPKPLPNDSGRVMTFSSWLVRGKTLFLIVSTHDADCARHVRLEITQAG